jgi:hypothetical protein
MPVISAILPPATAKRRQGEWPPVTGQHRADRAVDEYRMNE